MFDSIAFIIAAAVMFPGIAMSLVPLLPALPYMFAVSFIFAIVDGFSRLSGNELWILFFIALASIVVDQLSGVLGAKLGGAHAKSLLWGIAGSLVGTLMAPLLGSFVGLFAGVLAGEIYYKKSKDKAIKAAGSALLGTVAGVAANVVLAVCFFALFIFFALR